MKNFSKLTISSAFIALLICVPALIILTYIFTPSSEIWIHLKDTVLIDYVYNSLYIMIGVALMTTVIGFSTAYITTMYKFSFSVFFHYALILPFAIPTYIIAFIYAGMFDMTGSITTFFLELFNKKISEINFYDIMSIEGAIIVMSLVLYPYVYLITKTYLRAESASVIDAAKTMGLSSWQIFYKVVLPLSRPAIVAGAILAVMEAVSDFGVVDYYGVSTFVTGIFRTWFGMGSVADASKLAAMLMTFIFLLIFLERYQRRNKRYKSSGKDFKPISKIQLKGFKNILAFITCFLPFFFGFLLPFVQMCFWFQVSYEEIIDEDFYLLLKQTLFIAIGTAALITALALLFVYNARRTKSKTTDNITQVAKLGYSIPGAVIAVGILTAFSLFDNSIIYIFETYFNINPGLIVGGTIAAVVFGYTVRFIAIAINNYESGFSKIPTTYDDATKTLQVSEKRAFTSVFAPLLKNTIFAAFIMVFIEIIKELPLTMILRPFNFDTLAVRSYELTQQGQIVESSVPSMFIVFLGIMSVLLLAKNMIKD